MPFALSLFLACATPESPPPAEIPAPAPAAPAPAPPAPAPVAAPTPAPAPRINLNTATERELADVPGAGPKMVHEFVEYRPYPSIQVFRKEMAKYVDAERIAGFEKHVYVPIDPAKSDAATLAQIPGLDEAEAAALVAGRPYADSAAFEVALAAALTPEELAYGKGMLAAP